MTALVLGFVSVLLAAAVSWDNAANRGIAGVAPSPPIPWADVERGGVNTYGLHLEVVTDEQRRTGDNKVARTFKMIHEGNLSLGACAISVGGYRILRQRRVRRLPRRKRRSFDVDEIRLHRATGTAERS